MDSHKQVDSRKDHTALFCQMTWKKNCLNPDVLEFYRELTSGSFIEQVVERNISGNASTSLE
ncbi:hypothetical protein EZMO1_1095 [Endozoicomonas montiporae CL-33]|uniref:Uncharacterized protein n=1 Tax=Endozoicomonas montiporae CL-33 TaxID=570277 RepID=A0A142B967_9GAMM|nr:hypothetical protein EZMO1_1095 [Endozoicomonas montiporae CL-33]